MSDDAFHEIQLNGKQLVFLFMSATVVAVVIFLMGVMVGRGVRVPHNAALVEAVAGPSADPTAAVQPAPVASTDADGTPATIGETLTYAQRLDDPKPAPETLQSTSAKSAEPPPAPKTTPAPKPETAAVVAKAAAPKAATPPPAAPVPAKTAALSTVSSEPKGNGYVVQVAATRSRSEADTIARRLSGKGYPTFVTTGGANVFRVRVGKYADRHQAETIAHKLQKEEQFKPWITR